MSNFIDTAPSGAMSSPKNRSPRQDVLPSAFALIVYIQFSLIISFVVINSRVVGFTSTNHGDGDSGIDTLKD
jgi:hypothetical protein